MGTLLHLMVIALLAALLLATHYGLLFSTISTLPMPSSMEEAMIGVVVFALAQLSELLLEF